MTLTSTLTAERLRALLDYDPETGAFTWRERRGRATAGKPAGFVRKDGYVVIRVDGVSHTGHRLAWLYVHGEWPEQDTDHFNGTRCDNRIANLRDVSRAINIQNQRKATATNKTGVFGAHVERGHFRSHIRINGRQVRLGSFATAAEANAAYVEAKRKHHEGCTV